MYSISLSMDNGLRNVWMNPVSGVVTTYFGRLSTNSVNVPKPEPRRLRSSIS